jgi:hypothetical protein
MQRIIFVCLLASSTISSKSAMGQDIQAIKRLYAIQQAELQKLKEATGLGQITIYNSNEADGERIAIPHPTKSGWVQFLASKNLTAINSEDRPLSSNESLPGKGWVNCICSLSYFEAGTCGGQVGRKNLGRGRGDGSGSSYGELRGFTCSYDPATGGIIAGVWWGNQGGCNALGVAWQCRK